MDYVTKPIGPSVLLARVRTQIAAHAQRRSLEGMFKDVIEFAPVIFFVADECLSIVQTNAQAEQHFGYGRHELTVMNLKKLLPHCLRFMQTTVTQLNTQPGEAKIDVNPELTCLRSDGTTFLGSATFSRLETLNGLIAA
jgi:PAS domain S-box-containing protein